MRVQVNKKELGHKPQERGKGNLQGKKSQDDRDSTGVKGDWSNGSRSESARTALQEDEPETIRDAVSAPEDSRQKI